MSLCLYFSLLSPWIFFTFSQPNFFSYLQFKFIREYTSKVDELVKDKLNALDEMKTKQEEEKDIVAQQVKLLTQFYGVFCFT